MKNIFKPVLAIALIGLPGTAISQVADARPTDGIWNGGYRSNSGGMSGTIQARFQAINDLAKLDLEMKSWGKQNIAGKCNYIIALNDTGVDVSYATETAIYNGACPQEIDFTFNREGPESLTLTLSGKAASLFALEAFELRTSLRPPLATDLRTPVPNLDILGTAPGMSEDEAHKLLISQGFSLVAEEVDNFGYFTRKKLAYGRKPDVDNNPADIVGIRLSADADWLKEDPVVMLVGRETSYFAEDAMSETKLKEALLAKYGPSTNPASSERYWSRDGQADPNSTRSRLGKTVPFVNDIAGVNGTKRESISIEGGPRLNVRINEPIMRSEGDPTIKMNMSIEDPDPIWKDFWLTWAHQSYGEMKQIMDQEAADTPPPEL